MGLSARVLLTVGMFNPRVVGLSAKAPDWSNEELNGQQLGTKRDRWCYKAGRISRKRNLGMREEGGRRKGKNEGEPRPKARQFPVIQT